jgi:DnaJ-class molecular chaperone
MEDPYKTLGVSVDSSENEILSAFKYKLKPFMNRDLSLSEKKLMVAYKHAYKIIGTYRNRRDYDNQRDGLSKNMKQIDKNSIKVSEEFKDTFSYENNCKNYTPNLMRPFQHNFGLPKIDLDLENQFRMQENTFKKLVKEKIVIGNVKTNTHTNTDSNTNYHMASFANSINPILDDRNSKATITRKGNNQPLSRN